MQPTYERAYIEYDEFESRARFLTVGSLPVEQSSWNEFSASLCCVPRLQVSEDVLTKEQRDALPIQDSCKPLFVFYKVKFVGW
jgi:hypothetical protein